ncbi:hypothetical protein D3C80_1868760 [compost metagenome]
MNRLTLNGRSVSARTRATPSRIAAGDSVAAAKEPRAPALHTAATSSGVVAPPAMGAWISGWRTPVRLANSVLGVGMAFPPGA